MRKITKMIGEAFRNGKSMVSGNSCVVVDSDSTMIVLHGNRIVLKNSEGLFFSLCGWNTPTTRERLQAAGISISQSKFNAVTNQDISDLEGNVIPAGSVISDSGVYKII